MITMAVLLHTIPCGYGIMKYRLFNMYTIRNIDMKRAFKWLASLVIIVALVLAGLVGWFYYAPNTFQASDEVVALEIEQEDTGLDIAQKLEDEGLVRSGFAFRLAIRITGEGYKLQSGHYEIPKTISVHDLIPLLQKGKDKEITLTIPEGYTIGDIANLLEKEKICTAQEFLERAKVLLPYPYMRSTQVVSYPIEGFLFPSTYKIPVGASADDVITIMANEFDKQLTPALRQKAQAQGLNVFQLVTLASLVEKEALFDQDRPIIAAVFKRRLQEGMPLQSDATISYILGYAKVHVTLADTKLQSPYNTYINPGLPPGPICNPGMKSLEAVANAGTTDYRFFVADKEGHNHFSKTYEEHLKVVESIYGTE